MIKLLHVTGLGRAGISNLILRVEHYLQPGTIACSSSLRERSVILVINTIWSGLSIFTRNVDIVWRKPPRKWRFYLAVAATLQVHMYARLMSKRDNVVFRKAVSVNRDET